MRKIIKASSVLQSDPMTFKLIGLMREAGCSEQEITQTIRESLSYDSVVDLVLLYEYIIEMSNPDRLHYEQNVR